MDAFLISATTLGLAAYSMFYVYLWRRLRAARAGRVLMWYVALRFLTVVLVIPGALLALTRSSGPLRTAGEALLAAGLLALIVRLALGLVRVTHRPKR